MTHRVVNTSQRRNLERLANLASTAMTSLSGNDQLARQFAEEFARLMAEEGYVLTRQVSPR